MGRNRRRRGPAPYACAGSELERCHPAVGGRVGLPHLSVDLLRLHPVSPTSISLPGVPFRTVREPRPQTPPRTVQAGACRHRPDPEHPRRLHGDHIRSSRSASRISASASITLARPTSAASSGSVHRRSAGSRARAPGRAARTVARRARGAAHPPGSDPGSWLVHVRLGAQRFTPPSLEADPHPQAELEHQSPSSRES